MFIKYMAFIIGFSTIKMLDLYSNEDAEITPLRDDLVHRMRNLLCPTTIKSSKS